jgi:putative flavoprotein involved in K+ transport
MHRNTATPAGCPSVDEYVHREHLDVIEEPPAEVLDDGYGQLVVRELDVHSANITSIVWCTGYQFDFSWVHLPVFDEMGYPIHESGLTASPGLYFLGMHWRSRPVSAFVGGVAAEAGHIAAHIAASAMRSTDMRSVAFS